MPRVLSYITVEIYSSGLFHRWKYLNRIVQYRYSSLGETRIFDLANMLMMVRSSCVLNGLNGSSNEWRRKERCI